MSQRCVRQHDGLAAARGTILSLPHPLVNPGPRTASKESVTTLDPQTTPEPFLTTNTACSRYYAVGHCWHSIFTDFRNQGGFNDLA